MTLSDVELERYARQIVLPQVGGIGQRRLKASSVAIVGAGAIGGAVLAALAGAGVGKLTIIDDDRVERSNLHRQLIFRDDQVSMPKAEAAAGFATALNPLTAVTARAERVTAENAIDLLSGHDIAIDGTDNFATRLAVNDACVRLHLQLVSAAAAQFQGQLIFLRGWEPGRPCYRCFVGDAFDNDDCDTCAEQGVLGSLTGMVGNMAALLAINVLAGPTEPEPGVLHLVDGLKLSSRQIRIMEASDCKTCALSKAS